MADEATPVGDHEVAEAAAVAAGDPTDFFDHEPTKQEKIEMRKASKPPSEWLELLCKDWAAENEDILDSIDAKFLQFKSYMKGLISAQLLCRLSIPTKESQDNHASPNVDLWGILGIVDEFDKSYIIAQVERFCSLYSIRGGGLDDVEGLFPDHLGPSVDATAAAQAAAAVGLAAVSPNGTMVGIPYLDPTAAAAAAAAAAAVTASDSTGKLTKKQAAEVSRAHKMAKDAEKALEAERRQTMKREQRRLSQERKEQRAREREAIAVRKAAERASREATREDRRRKKLELRVEREKFAQEQKDAALKRAAELVASNRVPIEITRGAAAAKAAANAAVAASGMIPPIIEPEGPRKKSRSSIVVSTAYDLHQIVTHAKNLWTKYNAIAKEHNQKVNWITVARELGIHVKVREKYARMHSRAEQRGFDWERNGHFKIKDHPQIFLEPTPAEQKAKMPPPPPDPNTTVLIDQAHKEVQVSDEAVAAAAAAAVVDASVKVDVDTVVTPTDEHVAAAAVAATLVADPTAGIVDDTGVDHTQV